MPDFSALLDSSTPLFEARAQNRRQTSPVRGLGYPRKKVSISLAAGLIMNTDSPKTTPLSDPPLKQSLDGTKEEEEERVSEDALFYAYALKVSFVADRRDPHRAARHGQRANDPVERLHQLPSIHSHLRLTCHMRAMVGSGTTRVPRRYTARPTALCPEE
jgi:hypothetical protein